MPPKGFLTTQWDMYVAEDFGFEKLDILSQRGIGHIKDCADIVAENRAIKVDVPQVDKFKKDPKVKSQLKNGETNGCFYIESPATRLLQQKAGVGDFEHLVIHSSIIRTAANAYIQEYVRRLRGGGRALRRPAVDHGTDPAPGQARRRRTARPGDVPGGSSRAHAGRVDRQAGVAC